MAEVTCVGICVWDVVFRVDRFPTAPAKYRANERSEVGGGVAANAAATVAALGGGASLISCVGSDPTGERIVDDLVTHGVGTAGVRRVDGCESPLSAVFVDRAGERWIFNHASGDLFDRPDPPTVAEFDDADAVLADMRWPSAAAVAFAAAGRRRVPAVLDCDHDPGEHVEVLAGATHLVFSLPTLTDYVGHSDPREALEAASAVTGGMPIATDGAHGVYWLQDGAFHHLPAFEVEVVDTLGAGDVFHGAFALALAESRPVREALELAGAAAALKCTRFGGRSGIPTRAEVEQFVDDRRRERAG